MSNLQAEIGSLSAAEKFELLDVLWESLEADPPALTEDQRAELDHRVTRYQQNPSDVISWEQVRAGLFKKQ
jgi:putative addiction module component (TIGR02574 family)